MSKEKSTVAPLVPEKKALGISEADLAKNNERYKVLRGKKDKTKKEKAELYDITRATYNWSALTPEETALQVAAVKVSAKMYDLYDRMWLDPFFTLEENINTDSGLYLNTLGELAIKFAPTLTTVSDEQTLSVTQINAIRSALEGDLTNFIDNTYQPFIDNTYTPKITQIESDIADVAADVANLSGFGAVQLESKVISHTFEINSADPVSPGNSKLLSFDAKDIELNIVNTSAVLEVRLSTGFPLAYGQWRYKIGTSNGLADKIEGIELISASEDATLHGTFTVLRNVVISTDNS